MSLLELHPDDEILLTWAKAVKSLYEQAVEWCEHGPDTNLSPRKPSLARVAQQRAFEQQLWLLCQPFVKTSAPQHTLCERVERFLPELFVFVAVPGVPAHNNLAERSVRPLVIARKISGGSRSPKGSQTRMGRGPPLWHLDRSEPQPLLSMPRHPYFEIFFGLMVNSITASTLLTNE